MRTAPSPIPESEATERLARQLAPAIECGGGGLPRNLVSESWFYVDGKWYSAAEWEAISERKDAA